MVEISAKIKGLTKNLSEPVRYRHVLQKYFLPNVSNV